MLCHKLKQCWIYWNSCFLIKAIFSLDNLFGSWIFYAIALVPNLITRYLASQSFKLLFTIIMKKISHTQKLGQLSCDLLLSIKRKKDESQNFNLWFQRSIYFWRILWKANSKLQNCRWWMKWLFHSKRGKWAPHFMNKKPENKKLHFKPLKRNVIPLCAFVDRQP